MSQIDISEWKEFKVGDILNINSSKYIYHARNLYIEDNKLNNKYYPYVVRTEFNNGIRGYIEEDQSTLNSGHTISLAQDTAQFFYQEEPYFTGNKIKICALNDDTVELTKNKALFLISALYKAFATFSYDSSFNVTRLNKVIIKLPVDKDGDPDWQYMDTYIAKLTALAHKNVSSLKQAKAKPAKLSIDHWGEFKVSDWFDIRPSKYTKENGKVLKNAELFDGGNNPVIVNSNTNNGIGGYTSKPLTEQGNVITYSDTTDGASTIFYQDKPFVGYSHVKVILPKSKLSQATMIYLTSIIISAIKNQKYDFSYKLTTDKMLNTIIKLPIDAKGEPDWEYMDNQVRHLATLSDLTITSLNPAKLPIFIGEWKEFSVNKVFNVFTGAQVPRRYLINGSQDRISVTNENNGVISKFDENELLKSSNARILTNFVSINFFGYAFYHKNKASLEMKVHAIQRKDDVSFSENQGLYIASLLNSQYAGKYGYGNQLSSSKLKNKVIKLPVNLQGDPDWQYMDQYISWIKQYSKNKLTLIQ